MKLIFIYGYPGTGKLTVANELSKITKYKVFHNHLTINLISNIFNFGSIGFIKLREKIWLETFKTASEENMTGLIFTFSFEKTVSRNFISNIKQCLDPKDQILFIELYCDNENLRKRIEASSRSKIGKLSSYDKLKTLIENDIYYDPDIEDYVYKIDNSNLNPGDVSELIIEKYKLL